MKLLHQFIENKGMVFEDISLFFSKDASKGNISENLRDAYD